MLIKVVARTEIELILRRFKTVCWLNMKKAFLLLFILLLFSAVTFVDSASPAATRNLIYVRSDGSVEPSTAPIQRVGNVYTFTDDIKVSVIVERDNCVVDGAGFTLQGTGVDDFGSNSDLIIESHLGSDQEEVDERTIPSSSNTGIYSCAQNLTIMNLKIMEFWCGIELEYSSDNHIVENEIANNNQGIWIHSSSNNVLVGNKVTANSNGISLKASYNTVSGNTIADNRGYGIQLVWSFNNISENVITNSDHGVQLDGSCRNTFRNNVFSANTYSVYISGHLLTDFLQDIDETNSVEGKPIYYWVNRKDLTVPSDAGWVALVNCTGILVQDLNLTKKWQASVLLVSTSESTVTRNSIKNSDQGICLIGSVNNSISGNMVTNDGGDGIAVKESSNDNVISENTLTDNGQGIYLRESSNNTLRRNVMMGNEKHLVVYCGDSVYPLGLSRFIHDVDASNTVDGKPVIYWVNEHDRTVPSDAGHVVLVNCTNIRIENLNIAEGSSVHLAWSTDSCITKNTVSGYGILLYHSSNNIVSENNACGITLYFSSNSSITKNNATNSREGIRLSASSHNSITENSITDNNNNGIYLGYIQTIGGVSDPDPNATIYGYRNYESSHNIISGNNITSSMLTGIDICRYCSNNTIEDNSITKNDDGVNVGGENNTVTGNSITDNSGWGIAVDSLNNTVSKNYLSNNGDGIRLSDVSDITVSGNRISNSKTGINLEEASDNCLAGNTITNNTCGINLTRQPDSGIILYPYTPGVRLGSLRNNVSANLISDCTVGVQLDHSANNTFVHNSFMGNPTQVINHNSTYANTWDNGAEGNHWSDYNGTDSDGDGVGDTPYIIDENNQDNCPLMNPLETLESDGKPSITDLVLVVIAVVVLAIIVVGVAFYRRNRKT
jgi:parallel beta-helix repeat protein